MHRVQFGWCLRLCLMVMLLSVYLLIAALITTGSAYGRGSGLFSLSSSSDSSSTKMLALDQKGNRRRQNKSVLDSQTMERALQSKSMAVLLAVNKRHVQHKGAASPSNRISGSRLPAIHWCRPLGYRAAIPQRDSIVALASFPGSGNTWLRYLLQQATGIITGSVYKDHALLRNGFPGESVTDASVLAVKTHEHNTNSKFKFNKVILLVRDPFEALQAEFNRQSGGHIGHASANSYKRQGGKHWKSFVYNGIVKWSNTNTYWYESFPDPSSRHVIFYDKLISDTQHELEKLLEFLNIDITKSQMECTMTHKEGLYHRSKKKVVGVELFDAKMRQTINDIKERVYKVLKDETDNKLLSSTNRRNL